MTLPDDLAEHSDDSPATLESLSQGYQNLRTMFQALLMIVLVLSGSLNIFLLRQVSLVRKEVEDRKKFMAAYETNSVPLMTNFVARLQEFTRAHPDFGPILSRYGIPSGATPPPAAPSDRTPK